MHDMVEDYLKKVQGSNSLTLFRHVYQNDSEADQMHRLWINGQIIPLRVRDYCEAELNRLALELLQNGELFTEYDHLAGALK